MSQTAASESTEALRALYHAAVQREQTTRVRNEDLQIQIRGIKDILRRALNAFNVTAQAPFYPRDHWCHQAHRLLQDQ
jgi:hypothetical protein